MKRGEGWRENKRVHITKPEFKKKKKRKKTGLKKKCN
jgi:hypothetical protein